MSAPAALRLAAWLHDRVLQVCPAEYVAAYGDEVRRTFADVSQGVYGRGILALLGFTLVEVLDLVSIALRHRLRRSPLRLSVPAGSRRRLAVADDIRQATRRLTSRPATLAVAAGMLALGIGATTAMFTIVDALLLRPVPFNEPERLVQIGLGTEHGGSYAVPPEVFRAWRDSPVFESVQAATPGTSLIDTPNGPVARASALVTTGVFDMLGVRPVRGRLFDSGDGRPGTADRVLLSEDIWRTVFGEDPSLVGRRVSIDGEALLVVGILPSHFRFPSWDVEIWKPMDYLQPPPGRAHERPWPYARLAARVPQADAVKVATEAAHAGDPSTARLRAQAWPLVRFALDDYSKRAVPLLAGGVVLVFLVLCANVCSLLLARMIARRREYSVCSALGAGRGRLLREALLENAMLGAVAAAAGLGTAWVLVSLARALLPKAFLLRTLNPVHLDIRALLVTSVAGVAAIVAAGVLPAWLGTRVAATDSLRGTERGGTETRGARSVTRALLVGETALACALLVGAALLVGSFVALVRTDRGLDASGVMTAWVILPAGAFPDAPSRAMAVDAIDREIRELPDVREVALSFGVPPSGGAFTFGKWLTDVPGSAGRSAVIESYRVGSDFFALYRVPLLRGRPFGPHEPADSVIISERTAALLFPGTDPVGHVFRPDDDKTWRRVVGVAKEINRPSLDTRLDRPEFYYPLNGSPVSSGLFMASLRCGRDCPDPARVRQRLLAAAPGAQVWRIGRLEDDYLEDLARPKAAAALAFVFALVALMAAGGGLFSVLSYAVSRRQRELGVRAALGADPARLRQLVMRDGLVIGLQGVALGCAGGWLLSRGIASLEYGISARSPLVWIATMALVLAAGVLASWRPARRAASADPARLLREP